MSVSSQSVLDSLADASAARIALRSLGSKSQRFAIRSAALRPADRLSERSPYSAWWLARQLARHAFAAIPGLRGLDAEVAIVRIGEGL